MTPSQALQRAIKVAATSPCAKSKRGVVIFGTDKWISTGCNGPIDGPCQDNDACRAACNKICVHAEQSALLDAVRYAAQMATAPWSEGRFDLLHVKIVDGQAVPSGPPSCTECSKLILASGIIERVWLLHEIGADNIPADALAQDSLVVIPISEQLMLVSYTAERFHRLSLAHRELPVFEGDPSCP